MIGMKHSTYSDETKEKYRLAALGNKKRLGKKHSEETKQKMRDAWISRR